MTVHGHQFSLNETTPGIVRSKVIVPDPSLDGLEIKKYLNKNNKGCKIINYGGLVLVAATRSPHVNTKHTVAMDVNNQPLEQRCPIQSCKELFVHGVTVIAPMTVVGPLMHGYIGDEQWVCVKHWKQSIEDASDDDFCASEALVYDAGQLEENAGLKKLSKRKKASPKAKKQILAVAPHRPKRISRKKAVKGNVSPDIFDDSEAIIDDSEDLA